MPDRNPNLDGNAPDQAKVALLLIDVVNDLEFEGGDGLLAHAQPMATRLGALKQRAKRAGVPVIYANDNFGKWRSDFRGLVAHVLEAETRGKPLVEALLPDADDYFVLKLKHSAFYASPLDTLLDYLGVDTLILTGLTGDSCVLFTAMDAYMRDFRLVVPPDGIASMSLARNEAALAQMRRVMKAQTWPSAQLLRDTKEVSRY